MRRHTITALLLLAGIIMLAGTGMPLTQRAKTHRTDTLKVTVDTVTVDTISGHEALKDSLLPSIKVDSAGKASPDTIGMDSLQLAVYMHNKHVDDSIRLDSLNRQKKNGIDAPVEYSANDSIIYDASTNTAFLYGSSKVDYENMNLESDKIYMSLDSSLVHATGSPDSRAWATCRQNSRISANASLHGARSQRRHRHAENLYFLKT